MLQTLWLLKDSCINCCRIFAKSQQHSLSKNKQNIAICMTNNETNSSSHKCNTSKFTNVSHIITHAHKLYLYLCFFFNILSFVFFSCHQPSLHVLGSARNRDVVKLQWADVSVQCVQSCDVAARKQPTKNLGRVERTFGFGRCVCFFLHSEGVLKLKSCLLLHSGITHCKF